MHHSFHRIVRVTILLFFLWFSFNLHNTHALGPIGPWQLIFQKAVEGIFEKMFQKALSSRRFENEFDILEAKAGFDKVYNEQKSKLREKHESELVTFQDKFNRKWSNEKATGTTEERMERAKLAKQEEEEAFQSLRKKHHREEQELEEAYRWVIEHYIDKRYFEYLEKLKNAKWEHL